MGKVSDNISKKLHGEKKTWLVTGAAGFIGSNLCSELLKHNQNVVGVDNFVTGLKSNIEKIKKEMPEKTSFTFYEEDVRSKSFLKVLEKQDIDYINHQAALGSVPRSIENPFASHDHNVNGFVNLLSLCKERNVPLTFASSSSVYGDEKTLPKSECKVGKVLSPYAATKKIKEIYGQIFAETYDLSITGLRYFNIFGPRQNPSGAYAAVIPKWLGLLSQGKQATLFGDGSTTRDFTYIQNAVNANILSHLNPAKNNEYCIYNIAAERRTSLLELYEHICTALSKNSKGFVRPELKFENFRPGDVKDSLADVSEAKKNLGYAIEVSVGDGIDKTVEWFINEMKSQ